MSRAEGIIAFQIRPGTKFELEAPGDIRFGQVALDATLVDQKRTSLRMTHVRLHDHDGEDDAADDEDEEQHGKATVTLANLIPGVIETQLLGGFVVSADERVIFEVVGKNTLHISGNIILQELVDETPSGSELGEEELDVDDEELEGMDEEERNEFLKALSRDGETKVVQDAPASSAPAAVAVTSPGPAKKLSKKEQKALKQAAAAAASSAPATTTTTPTAAASTTVTAKTTTMTTTATTGTTTKAAAAEAPTSAVAGKKRRASDANASPAKEGEGNQKTDVVVKQKQKEQGPAAKKVKGQDGTAQPAAESKESKESKESEESREKPKEKKEKKPEKAASSFTTPGGVKISDKKVGDGAGAKKGQRLEMRYILKLANGKVVDKNTSGAPFKFRLGAGEVIKGWDEGLVGMKVGGERTLEVPAHMGYGKKSQSGIPGNSTLFFEVKLLNVG